MSPSARTISRITALLTVWLVVSGFGFSSRAPTAPFYLDVVLAFGLATARTRPPHHLFRGKHPECTYTAVGRIG